MHMSGYSPTHPRLRPNTLQARRSDSRAFLDSDECERARFEVDWIDRYEGLRRV